MTSGLQWWHEICREVRESGAVWKGSLHEERVEDEIQELIVDAVQKFDQPGINNRYPGNERPGLTENQYQFLRTQWLAAYRKAKQ